MPCHWLTCQRRSPSGSRVFTRKAEGNARNGCTLTHARGVPGDQNKGQPVKTKKIWTNSGPSFIISPFHTEEEPGVSCRGRRWERETEQTQIKQAMSVNSPKSTGGDWTHTQGLKLKPQEAGSRSGRAGLHCETRSRHRDKSLTKEHACQADVWCRETLKHFCTESRLWEMECDPTCWVWADSAAFPQSTWSKGRGGVILPPRKLPDMGSKGW